jgi:hypothetical protein
MFGEAFSSNGKGIRTLLIRSEALQRRSTPLQLNANALSRRLVNLLLRNDEAIISAGKVLNLIPSTESHRSQST